MEQQVYENLLQAVNSIHNPRSTAQQRRDSQSYCDKFVDKSANSVEYGLHLASQVQGHPDTVRHFGLHCVEYFVRYRWANLGDVDMHRVKDLVLEMCANGVKPSNEPTYIKEKAVRVLTEVAKRMWPQNWPSLSSDLTALNQMGVTQSELVFLFYRTLVEDVMGDSDGNLPPKRRKDLRASLGEIAPELLGFSRDLTVQTKQILQNSSSLEKSAQAISVLRSILALFNVTFSNFGARTILQLDLIPLVCEFLQAEPKYSELRLLAIEGIYTLVSRSTLTPPATKGTTDDSVAGDAKQQEKEMKVLLLKAVDVYRNATGPLLATEDDEDYRFFKQIVQTVCTLVEKVVLDVLAEDEGKPGAKRTVSVQNPTNRILIPTTTPTPPVHPHQDAVLALYPVYLNLLTEFVNHPSTVIGTYAASVLLLIMTNPRLTTATTSELANIYQATMQSIPRVLQGTIMLVMKNDGPDSELDTAFVRFASLDFDSEDAFHSWHSSARGISLQLAQKVAMVAPVECFELLIGHLNDMATAISQHEATTASSAPTPTEVYVRWEALSNVFGKIVTGMLIARVNLLKVGAQDAGSAQQVAAIENSIQASYPALLAFEPRDSLLMSAHLNTLSAYLPYLAINPSHLMAYLDMLFTHLYKTCPGSLGPGATRPTTVDGDASVGKDAHEVLVRRSACKFFIRACIGNKEQMMPLMEEIVQRVESLWSENMLSWGERGLLIEGILITSNAMPNTEQQNQLLNRVAGDTVHTWTSPEVAQGFSSTTEFVKFVGLDSVDQASWIRSQAHRETLIGCVKVIYAAAMRLEAPKLSADGVSGTTFKTNVEHVFTPMMMAVLPNMLSMIRCVHELWTVNGQKFLSPQLHEVLSMSENEARFRLTGQKLSAEEKKRISDSVAEGALNVDAVRAFLNNMRENSYLALRYMIGIPSFYLIPDLPAILTNTVFNGLDQMRLHHLRFVTKNVVHALVEHCPDEHYTSVLAHLLPGYISFITQLLDEQWTEFMARVPDPRTGSTVGQRNTQSPSANSENEEVLILQGLCDATTETMDVWAVLMRSEKGGGLTSNSLSRPQLDTLESYLKSTDIIREPLTVLVYRALSWRADDCVHKASRAAMALTPYTLNARGKDREFYKALVTCAVQGLIKNGSEVYIQRQILELLNLIYRKARITFYGAGKDDANAAVSASPVAEVLSQLSSIDMQALIEYDAHVMNEVKKEQIMAANKLMRKEIGKNVNEMFKKTTSILDLPPSEYLARRNKRNVALDNEDPAVNVSALFDN
eukprot:CFRG4858T1